MTSDRSLGNVWTESSGRGPGPGPGSGPGGRYGSGWGVPQASLRPPWEILCSLGDATWASPERTAITWMERGCVVPRSREFGC